MKISFSSYRVPFILAFSFRSKALSEDFGKMIKYLNGFPCYISFLEPGYNPD